MEGIYEVSSSERVKRLEEDLCKELKELQNAIEENDFLKTTSQSHKSFSSVPVPKDAGHFRRERKIALAKALQVRGARGLECQADTMNEEIKLCGKVEYSNKSLPLLLHQFYVDRIQELVHCKHMHMLRWARFCEHTKTIEMLYPQYQERLSLIMSEYQDAVDRARRLAVAREAALAGVESAMNVVTLDDLLIYTRSLICQLHSVKKIHAFLKIIEWLPYARPNAIQLHTSKSEPSPAEADSKLSPNNRARRRYSRVMSQVGVVMQLNLLRSTPEEPLPTPPPLSLSSYQLVASTSPSVAAAAAASGGGLASDEINLGIPLHETSLDKLKPMLEFFIGCYAIEMDAHQVNTYADEMELFTLVSRKFKKIFSKQEQLRKFPVYDALMEDLSDNKIRSQGIYYTFKKESNWISFLHLRPEKTADQVKMMTKLRQQNNIDEILKTQATFLHVQDTQLVLDALRDHVKAVVDPPIPQPVSVTTHKTSYDTAGVWRKIFAQTMPSSSSRDDVLEFDAKVGEEITNQKESEFELSSAVEMLGLDDEDSRAKMAMQGAYMSFLLLRHLRLRDLQRTCLSSLNYFRSIERTLTINDSGLSLDRGRQKATNRQVFHGGGVQGLGSHQYLHNTPADFVVEQNEFMSFSEVENHDDFFTFEEGRVHVQDQRGFFIMYDAALADFKNLETDLLLVATRFIENDKERRKRKTSKSSSNQKYDKFGLSEIDISAYGHQHVDRFGVLLDLWSNEAIYLENKRQLLDTYYEAYQHTFNPTEKGKLAQVMVNILHKRPRFAFTEPYFVKLYRAENVCLRLQCNLIKSVLDKQIAEQREYVQKVTRDGDSEFGIPHRIIPKQSIAVNTSRPCLKYVYMLEFHPSLALAASIPKAIQHVLQVFLNANHPRGFLDVISIEKYVLELIQKEWDNMDVIGISHSQQTQKDLLDTYYEAYQHTFNPTEKGKLAQVMVNILHKRPRFAFTEPYFVKLYRAENVCLRLQCNLIKSVLDKQIAEQREYVQKVTRDGDSEFGIPHRIIPKQSIAVNTSRPCLKYVYMLEFHPSLALAASIPKAIQHVLQVFLNANHPRGFLDVISIEKYVLELIQKEWDNMDVIGISHSQQTQKDLFSEVFVEDPLFVCEVGQSQLSALESTSGGRRSVKERQQSLIKTWCHLLEVLTLRHRLVTTANETEVLMKIYKRKSKEFGFDEHHAYLRAVSFDFAQMKPEAELHRITVDSLIDDDGRIDRYMPGSVPLAIQELDEKHVGSMNFRTREGLMQLVSQLGVEKLQVILTSQVVHKNLLMAAVTLGGECSRALDRERQVGTVKDKDVPASGVTTLKVPGVSSLDLLDTESQESSGTVSPTQISTFTSQIKRERSCVPKVAFVSVQLEKAWLRDTMLNEYVTKKTNLSTVLKNVDETIKLKKKLILSFCEGLQMSVSEYSMRSQIIAYYGSLLELMSQFPTTRNAHFMIGEDRELKADEEDKCANDPTCFTPRPRRLLSSDAKQLVNLWFIPHYTEILNMFTKLPRNERNNSLKVVLEIVSSLHDICQYLCAHARLGSSHARLGSHKLEFSGVTADWGGTEGIGAELREIQKQMNHLENATNPQEVAEFLRHRRDVMYLEFDISVSHCVPDTFLQTGNELACKMRNMLFWEFLSETRPAKDTSITDNMEFALQNLSVIPRSSVYSWCLPVPEPFQSMKEHRFLDLTPWRTFLSRNGPFPFQYWPWYEIGTNMQLCLAGLRDVDRHVVNGEILGVSLLLEDVLQHGLPDDILGQPDDASSVTSYSSTLKVKDRKGSSRRGSTMSSSENAVSMETPTQLDIPRGQLSFNTDPLSAVKLLLLFLTSWSRLEVLKRDWGCRKLDVTALNTTKKYKAFGKAFKVDVLQPVYQLIALKKGLANHYDVISTASDNEPLVTPPDTADMELKIKQLVRLLENFECLMITDVIRKISRENTLVLTERGRDDVTLPTDLWKRPVMKESTTIEKPRVVENYAQSLMADHIDQDDSIAFPKTHFNICLVKLASETMVRERSCFDSYAMYYENLLRHQHQLLYAKEQEIKQIESTINETGGESRVDVHCQLADKSHELLLEITALRARIKELNDELSSQETEIRERLRKDYNNLVRELFSRCFSMKNKFEEFRGCLYDDVLESLSEVRRQAMENMRKLREKSGTLKDDAEMESSILSKAERIRRYQEENKHLGALFYKVKTLNSWKNTRMDSHHFETVANLREEADRAKKECLDIKKIAAEKEVLLKQEQAALRKALAQVEKEAQSLKKKLSHEQKAKLQKTHAQIQEARSLKQMELAKSTNLDKLISDLDERENQLRVLTENLTRDQKKNLVAAEYSKKTKKQMLHQLDRERNLKLGAFERVDELQRQVYDYEQVYELPRKIRPHTTPPTLLPPTSDTRLTSAHLTNYSLTTHSRSALSHRRVGDTRHETRSSYNGGIWPPPVPMPVKNTNMSDQGYPSF